MVHRKSGSLMVVFVLVCGCASMGADNAAVNNPAVALVALPFKIVGAIVGAAIGAAAGMGMMEGGIGKVDKQ